ncbi:hypothetical protein ACVIGB_000954 [Bradyrhizobium sp. USDA 4341]
MQTILQSTGHAKSLAKSLRRSLAKEGCELKLTAAQNAVARMFGYADHRALCASVGKGEPDPYEDEMEADRVGERRATFASRLAAALGVPPAKGMALVVEIGPLCRDRQGYDDWRMRRQSYFSANPLGDLIDWADFALWTPGLGSSRVPGDVLLDDLSKIEADPAVFGPKAYTVDVAFGKEVVPEFVDQPKAIAEKFEFGIEYVYAKIAMGDRVLGWLQGVVADMGAAKDRRDLDRAADLLDGPMVARAGELFERRIALEATHFAGTFRKVFVVAALVRHPTMTIPGAGAALFSVAANAVAARHEGPLSVVLNATPPQYDFAPDFPPSFGISDADERTMRSTGRAAAARALREFMLGLPLPVTMEHDVEAFDLDFPYRCAVPSEYGPVHPTDDPGGVFHVHDEKGDDRGRARALFAAAPDPAVEALLVGKDASPHGFDPEVAAARDRIVRPHPALWERMPRTVIRIEIERRSEHRQWNRVRWGMMGSQAIRDAFLRRDGSLRAGVTDTITFVFENGTQASVPDRQIANGDFGDVVGGAFTDKAGDPLRRNPYTAEMSIGDLWSMLTANAVLLYSGGDPVPFRDNRIVLTRPKTAGSGVPSEKGPQWLTLPQLALGIGVVGTDPRLQALAAEAIASLSGDEPLVVGRRLAAAMITSSGDVLRFDTSTLEEYVAGDPGARE